MPSDFLTVVLPLIGLLGLIDALMLYATYLSLSVWRGLSVPIFRSRALWMALFGIPLVVALNYSAITRTIIPTQSLLSAPIISEIMFTFAFIALFVWIDRMVASVIRLDYLRRDLLSWKRIRIAYWILVAISNVLFFSRYLYNSIPTAASLLGLVPLAYGSVVLAKGARTTSDMTFKSHVKWLGFLGSAIIPALSVYGFYGVSVPVPTYLLVAVVAYCFYKMARFLIPVGRLSADQG